jgi:uncharacterized membrane protein YhiD involved in acid resistance
MQIVMSFLLAFGLAFLWATVYRHTHTGIAYTRSFYYTLVLTSPIIAMIMMAIGSNVALSLGLVGSLSIIRFRTVIKDTKDMTYLLMAIAIGLCAGATTWLVGIIGTAIVAVAAVVLTRAGHDSVGSADYILVFRSNQEEPWSKLKPEAQSLIRWKQLRGATDLDEGQEFEYTYSVRLSREATPERVVSALSNGVMRQVTLITPENHLEL